MSRAAGVASRDLPSSDAPPRHGDPSGTRVPAEGSSRADLVTFLRTKLEDYPSGSLTRERLEELLAHLTRESRAG